MTRRAPRSYDLAAAFSQRSARVAMAGFSAASAHEGGNLKRCIAPLSALRGGQPRPCRERRAD
eukprot:6278963-Alexandrium_andersonii.AAC.1